MLKVSHSIYTLILCKDIFKQYGATKDVFCLSNNDKDIIKNYHHRKNSPKWLNTTGSMCSTHNSNATRWVFWTNIMMLSTQVLSLLHCLQTLKSNPFWLLSFVLVNMLCLSASSQEGWLNTNVILKLTCNTLYPSLC